MKDQSHRLAARGFTEANIGVLAADLLTWRRQTACLPETSKFNELARICTAYASEGDEYQEAERLVSLRALECVAQDFMWSGGSGRTADEAAGMTWWNALTDDERQHWMAAAGNTGVVADAWSTYKRNSN